MKKYILTTAIVFIISACSIYSAEIMHEFKGFPTVNINYNGQPLEGDVPAVNFYGNTMVPIRRISELFGAFVDWNGAENTVEIKKPHIDMILCDYYGEASSFEDAVEIEDSYGRGLVVDKIIGNPFSKFEVGTYTFNAYFDVSGLEGGKEYVDRVMIVDPEGNIIYNTTESQPYTLENEQTGYIYTLGFESVLFGRPGIYKFLFQFKRGDEFVTVYERGVEVYSNIPIQ